MCTSKLDDMLRISSNNDYTLQMLCTVQLKGNFTLAGNNSHVP